jgi:hypothetical protein
VKRYFSDLIMAINFDMDGGGRLVAAGITALACDDGPCELAGGRCLATPKLGL